MQKNQFILGIESSCDDTSIGIINGLGEVVYMKTYSQTAEHQQYKGVVPEIAARSHSHHIINLLDEALKNSGMQKKDCCAIAATAGPGLIGGLIVGSIIARSVSLAWNIPYIAINHLEGHALSPLITNEIAFPYLLLLVSGGHCQLLGVHGLGQYHLYGQTIDDSAGEAYDKCAKILGLSYPGGPLIQQYAERAVKKEQRLPIAMIHQKNADFSFSGLKSALNRFIGQKTLDEQEIAEWAYCVQYSINQSLIIKTKIAMQQFSNEHHQDFWNIAVAGGVAANQDLRNNLTKLAQDMKFNVHKTDIKYCTDNGAMIGYVGWLKYKNLDFSTRNHTLFPRWDLT